MTDTIAALATPFGRSALAVIRISGPETFSIVRSCCRTYNGEPIVDIAGGIARRVRVHDDGRLVDDAMLMTMVTPRSFTGEDTAEIVSHGAPVVIDAVMRLLIRHGARMAEGGEFSFRAYMNGKIDLAEAEAIHDLIMSDNALAAHHSVMKMQGTFSREIQTLRTAVKEARIMIEGELDFPDEDTGSFSYDGLMKAVASVRADIVHILDISVTAARLMKGVSAVIAGAVNTGKSSIFNALAGSSRAIVTDTAGTTRDVLHAEIDIDGIPFHLTDTAGLRETSDTVETIGVARAEEQIAKADVVLFVLDGSRPMNDEDAHAAKLASGKDVIVIRNKSDLELRADMNAAELLFGRAPIAVSAVTGAGMQELRAAMGNRISASEHHALDQSVYTNERERAALARGITHLDASEKAMREKRTIDVVSYELTAAERSLAEVLGEIRSDEIVTEIFSRFCIGK